MSSAAAGAAGLPCLEGDALPQLAQRLRLDRSEEAAAAGTRAPPPRAPCRAPVAPRGGLRARCAAVPFRVTRARRGRQHMEEELRAARESVRTELLDRLHGWTHANV